MVGKVLSAVENRGEVFGAVLVTLHVRNVLNLKRASGISRIWDSRSADHGTTPNLTSGNYTLIFRGGVPFEFGAFNYPIHPYNLDHYLGTFLKDTWTIKRRLTANLGLRFAHDDAFVPPQCRDAGDFAFTPAQCFDKVQLPIWNSIAPRVHVSFDATGDGKTVVKGGWGRKGATNVRLEAADATTVRTVLVTAWRNIAPKNVAIKLEESVG